MEDEFGKIREQKLEYEWKPLKCSSCHQVGHRANTCRVNISTIWVPKNNRGDSNIGKEVIESMEPGQNVVVAEGTMINKQMHEDTDSTDKEKEWLLVGKKNSIIRASVASPKLVEVDGKVLEKGESSGNKIVAARENVQSINVVGNKRVSTGG
ncbi:hypothetical protein ACFE04_021178 [Oxalis oulophora]